jgi:hypothetical protein
MRPIKFDHNNDLITLTVITKSNFEKLFFIFLFTDHEWKAVVQELSLLKEEVDRLREDIGDVKLHFKQVQTS